MNELEGINEDEEAQPGSSSSSGHLDKKVRKSNLEKPKKKKKKNKNKLKVKGKGSKSKQKD